MAGALKTITQYLSVDYIPTWLLRLVDKHIGLLNMRMAKTALENPYINGPFESEYEPEYPHCLGIIRDFWGFHWPYIQACREMKVAYRVIDLTASDWISKIETSECDAFLAWPSVHPSIFKQMFDERLRVMEQEMGKLICPSASEVWVHESKRRVAYWLKANHVPHPDTWIFYNEEECLDFVRTAELPLIFKPDRGSSARGIKVFRNRAELTRHVKAYFKRGMIRNYDDWRDLQWGSIVLQRFMENVDEWRMIRIGPSFFGYKKGKKGDFHSGTKITEWDDPPKDLLDFTEMICDLSGFTSMSFDILQDRVGAYYVNEFHPLFGRDPWDHSMEVDGKPGRYIRDISNGEWQFEEGIFTENSCCNLRVKMLLECLQAGERE